MSLPSPPLSLSTPVHRTDVTVAQRAYSTGAPQQSSASLAKLAAGGVAAGFTAALLYNYFNAAASEAHADGAAIPENPDTSGNGWQPIHALEVDDPKVCAGYRQVGVLRHVYGAPANAEQNETDEDCDAYRDLGVGLLLGFGLLLRVSSRRN